MWTVTESSSAGIDERLRRFAHHDVYHTSVFHDYDRSNGYGEICQYWYEDARGALFHPFMLRRIEQVGRETISEPLYDVETVKGMAGPLATSLDPQFLADAWAGYAQWCCDKGVVAEYVRFNPFVGNIEVGRQFFDTDYYGRIGVVVDLSVSEEQLWAEQYNVNQRNMIRKAEKLGVVIALDETDAAYDEFIRLQKDAWRRLNAQADRHYPERSLYYLKRALGPAAPLFVARLDSKIIAAAVFLTHGDVVHYQLSARDPEFSKTGAGNQLLHVVALWARERGFKHLHLGAGRTDSAEDELLRFKRCLSSGRVQYPFGTRRHLPERFADLCERWARQAPHAALGKHSMPYRSALPQLALKTA